MPEPALWDWDEDIQSSCMSSITMGPFSEPPLRGNGNRVEGDGSVTGRAVPGRLLTQGRPSAAPTREAGPVY